MTADGCIAGPGLPAVELGEIAAPVLICGGAYGNLPALVALFAAAEAHRIPPVRIIHTGDVIAYAARPVETAELLRASGAHAIQGNVEESLAARMPDCGCGFDEGTLCDRLSALWFAHADAQVGAELRHWMAALPHQLTFTMVGRRVRVVHGGVRLTNSFLYASTPDAVFEAELTAAAAGIVLAGHSGLPFTRAIGRRIWHNSGALGMPANDATARVWYSIVRPLRGAIRFEHHALDYDHRAARADMLAAGLPKTYADGLVSGLWPSLDPLPATERAATGVPLAPGAFTLSLPDQTERAALRL